MRFFAVLALVAAASASTIGRRQSFPSCANTCLASADFGTCDPLDDSCLCHNAGFVSSVTVCIEKACTGQDLQDAEAGARALCAAVGVTLTSTPTPTDSGASTPTMNGSSASTPTGSNTTSSPSSPTATSPSGSQTASGANTTTGSNGAASHGVNALAALAAVGAAAFVL